MVATSPNDPKQQQDDGVEGDKSGAAKLQKPKKRHHWMDNILEGSNSRATEEEVVQIFG